MNTEPESEMFETKCHLGRVAVWPVVAAVIFISGSARASGWDSDEAVEAGRRALSARSTFPWYDKQQDQLRRIDVKTPRESARNRGSMWQAAPAEQPRDLSWLGALLNMLAVALRWLAFVGLIALLVALTVLLARGFLMREDRGLAAEEAAGVSTKLQSDRIDNLPFSIARPPDDLLAEARRCYQRGDFSQAMVYLFSYQLLALDRHDLIRLARGKTNRQYVAELAQQPWLQELLRHSMVAFEDVFFGHHSLAPERFEGCWQSLDRFHQHLEQLAAS
jgi:hypothetical protein